MVTVVLKNTWVSTMRKLVTFVFEISPCWSHQQKCCLIQEGRVAFGRKRHGVPSFLGELGTEMGFYGVMDKSVRIHPKQLPSLFKKQNKTKTSLN